MWTFLLFLGVIARSSAANLGPCPQYATVQNFDIPEYLGRWYETEAYGNLWERIAVTCPKADYSLNETSGEVIVQNSGKSRFNGKETVFIGSAKSVADGKLTVTFPFPFGLSNTAPYWVLGTDYNNWAVVWSCTQYNLFNMDYSWILLRNRADTSNADINAAIQAVLDANGIKRANYVKIDQTNC